MAVRVMEKVFELLHRSPDVDIDSATIPLVGGSLAEQQAARLKAPALADEVLADRLWSTYGTEALGIVERIASAPAAGGPVGGLSELTLAEVEHAVESEMVITLDDLLRRRSSVAMFDGGRAAAAAVAVAACVGRLCGWSDGRVQAEADTVSQRAIGELATVKNTGECG
jgi:glycerol-3-phosphate dehydrogenase